MNYEQAQNYIFSFYSVKAKPSLERIKELCGFLNDPQKKLKTVHIAGTNGKGSTATFISSALTKSGYKTGLYTSPHLVSFCERIKINGEMISEEDVVRLIEIIIPQVEKMSEKPTFFDVVTAMAFLYFYENNCDIAVLECGLGGKYDSTNIVNPELSVITSVSMDHIGVLGNTIEKIADEKCGIIKSGVPLVSYACQKNGFILNPQNEKVKSIIENICKEKNSKCIFASPDEIVSAFSDENGTTIKLGDGEFRSSLIGNHQIANMLTAYTALKVLKNKYKVISTESIKHGFSDAFIEARLQKVSEKPLIILDGGHNSDCADALCDYIKTGLSGRKIYALVTLMKDKQCEEVLSKILPLFHKTVFTEVSTDRTAKCEELKKIALKYNENVESEKDNVKALRSILGGVSENDVLIVFGSFYLIGEIKNFFS